MTTKATDWVWEKVVEPADEWVAERQDKLATQTSEMLRFSKAFDFIEPPFKWSRNQIKGANHTVYNRINTFQSNLPHPRAHFDHVWERDARTMRFVGLGETVGLAGTRFVGNGAWFVSHVSRLGAKCVAYAAVGTPQTVAWAGIGTGWLATVAVPYTVIGVVGRAPLYVGGAVATVALETPPFLLRTAGVTWKFVSGAFERAWNGSPEAQARRAAARAAREGAEAHDANVEAPEADLPGHAAPQLPSAASRDGRQRSWLGRGTRHAITPPTPEGPQTPGRQGMGE